MYPIIFHHNNTYSNMLSLRSKRTPCALAMASIILLKMVKDYIPIQFCTVCYAYMVYENSRIFLYKPTCCMYKI